MRQLFHVCLSVERQRNISAMFCDKFNQFARNPFTVDTTKGEQQKNQQREVCSQHRWYCACSMCHNLLLLFCGRIVFTFGLRHLVGHGSAESKPRTAHEQSFSAIWLVMLLRRACLVCDSVHILTWGKLCVDKAFTWSATFIGNHSKTQIVHSSKMFFLLSFRGWELCASVGMAACSSCSNSSKQYKFPWARILDGNICTDTKEMWRQIEFNGDESGIEIVAAGSNSFFTTRSWVRVVYW